MTHAVETAHSICAGGTSAVEVVQETLARIERVDKSLNCFTTVLAERALANAGAVDVAIAAGRRVGPLAGVTFAVKNLFDVEGLTTRAGSCATTRLPRAMRRQSSACTRRARC